jgi:hypothetical protein
LLQNEDIFTPKNTLKFKKWNRFWKLSPKGKIKKVDAIIINKKIILIELS